LDDCGGDELALLLTEIANARDAAITAENVVAAMRIPFDFNGRELRVTASLGIATYPTDGTDAESLLRSADAAMYYAKERGRDNYQFFDAQMNARGQARRILEEELRKGVERREFVLHYQPMIDLQRNTMVGVEALIRWQHASRGLLQPGQFIGIAEDSALIVPIGKWVVLEACRQARLARLGPAADHPRSQCFCSGAAGQGLRPGDTRHSL